MTNTDIWTPSDTLLSQDPIALAKVANPHSADLDLVIAGDVEDDEANEVAAAAVLAEIAGDEVDETIEPALDVEDDTTVEDAQDGVSHRNLSSEIADL